MTWPDWLTPVMTWSAVRFYWLLYGSLLMWTYWSDQAVITGDQWADRVSIDGANAEDEADLSSRVTETERGSQSINDWSGCCSWRPTQGGRSLSAGPQRSALFRFSVLDCDLYLVSDLQGAAVTPEPPVPLLFLTFVASRPPPENQRGCSEAPPPTLLLWIQGFPKPSRLEQEGFGDYVLIVRCGSYGSPSGPW